LRQQQSATPAAGSVLPKHGGTTSPDWRTDRSRPDTGDFASLSHRTWRNTATQPQL